MRLALLVLFVLVWWPFHHKPTAKGLVHYPDSYCSRTPEGYFFLGKDGVIGVSKTSCDAAISDWRKNTGMPPTVSTV